MYTVVYMYKGYITLELKYIVEIQIVLLMKCCHENVQGWSPIFFLLLKKFGEFECILQWKKCFLLQERIGKKASNFFF